MSTRVERNHAMADYFAKKSAKRAFTITDVSNHTGVSTTALYRYMPEWVELGFIRETQPGKTRNREYKINDRNGLLRHLGVYVEQSEQPEQPAPDVSTRSQRHVPFPASTTGASVIMPQSEYDDMRAMMAELIAENERLNGQLSGPRPVDWRSDLGLS